MDIHEHRRDGTLILQPTGRLDSNSSQDLQSELTRCIDDGDSAIILDFKDLDYISSAGLRVLLVVGKDLQARDGRLSLCALNDNVREVFEISGFVALFPIYGSVEEAVAAAPGAA